MDTLKLSLSAAAFFTLLLLETLFPLFVNRKQRIRHVGRNMAIMLVNNVVIVALLSVATAFIFGIIEKNNLGLFNHVDLPYWLRLIFIILLFDLWMYIWHWMNHRYALLWRFHRMHHSDTEMDASTALRFHPGEIVLSTILRWGIFLAFGITLFDLLLYEIIMMPVILFVHSNFYLSHNVDKMLRSVIVTPWMHWVHHSQVYSESNSNYGTIFSWWDRLFKSFRLRSDPKNIKYGIEEIQPHQWQSIWGMLKTPFVNKFD